MIGIGVLGLGSVFWGSYRPQIERLQPGRACRAPGGVRRRRDAAVPRWRIGSASPTTAPRRRRVIGRDDVDLVMVLTSMPHHGRLAIAAMEAGKHVLVEKPMATTLPEATATRWRSPPKPTPAWCAPPTCCWRRPIGRCGTASAAGVIGDLHLARARYGWSGPWWGPWFYRDGGGSLFDLGCYNVTSLCGLLGSVKRVSAMVGTRIPQRVVDGELVDVEVDDNAQLLFDHGDNRFSTVMTGFTLQRYRSPAIELYGSTGSIQMMGHDWAPEGFEQWRNEAGVWEVFPETNPQWHWTYGFEHLIDRLESGVHTLTRPEHAYHVLEIMLAAKRSSAEGRRDRARERVPRSPTTRRFRSWRPELGFLHDPRMVT